MFLETPSIVAICTTISVLIVQVFQYLQSYNNSKKLEIVKDKTIAIETHVNGERTAAIARERALVEENKLLRQIVEDKKQTANLLAQSVAQAQPSLSSPPQ